MQFLSKQQTNNKGNEALSWRDKEQEKTRRDCRRGGPEVTNDMAPFSDF